MKKFTTIKTLLVGLLACAATSALAQKTWTFVGNTTVWGAEAVTLKGGAQYDENAGAVDEGGVIFTGTSGFVSTAKGIGFNATGSIDDENISIVVPKGYKATVSIYTSSNRTVVAHFGDADDVTFNTNWATSTKEFNNEEGTEAVTLYLYCNQNAGGSDQKKAPFVESIVLTDMSNVKSFPWTANAVATIDGAKTTLKTYNSSIDVAEGSEYTVVVDKVIKKDDVFYALKDEAFAPNVYCTTYTMGDAAGAHEFTYEKVEDAVFYGEVESIFKEGVRANKGEGISVLSNGGGYSAMGTEGYVTLSFNVPETAIYKLELGMNNTNDKERGFNYSIDGADVSETITVNATTSYVQEITEQTLSKGDHTITMNITYSLTPIFDYLLITKTGDVELPENVEVTVTAAGWATLYTDYALDFEGTGLAAYTATLSESTVKLTEVTSVPAGTGVVLQGEAKTYEIPVIESSETAKGDLKGSTTTATEANGNQYVLVMNESNAQFTKATSGSIAAGKAYLEKAESESRILNVVFAGEATGIKAIETAQADGNIYNMAGQRVAAPQKGLFIMNGKKVIIK